jgi:hypothetical protein
MVRVHVSDGSNSCANSEPSPTSHPTKPTPTSRRDQEERSSVRRREMVVDVTPNS